MGRAACIIGMPGIPIGIPIGICMPPMGMVAMGIPPIGMPPMTMPPIGIIGMAPPIIIAPPIGAAKLSLTG